MWVRMSFAVIGSFIVRVWDCLFWLYLWWKIMHLLGFKLTVNPCEVFSEAMPCWRYLRDILCRWWALLFSLYSSSEHVCSIIASMLRNLKSQQRSRLLSKFTENDCEKVCIIVILLVSSLFFLPCPPFCFASHVFECFIRLLLSSLPVVFFIQSRCAVFHEFKCLKNIFSKIAMYSVQ